jgi:hypothetical protein
VGGDELRRRLEALETELLPLTDPPATEVIRRRGRRRQRNLRVAVLLPVVLLGGLVARGAEQLARPDPGIGPVRPVPTTQPVTAPSSPPTTARPPTTTMPPTTGTPITTAAPVSAGIELRADGLGVVAFGAGERDALDRLERRLGAPEERGSWAAGANPFGTCPGPLRAVRWGRLYVLFTNGPTRYGAGGRWHLFAYQVDAVQRTKVDPTSVGPTPPPLRGYSPRTAAGIGFGSTLSQLRRAYPGRVQVTKGDPGMVYRFRVGFGAAGDLSGTLSGGTAGATVRGVAAGAICGE